MLEMTVPLQKAPFKNANIDASSVEFGMFLSSCLFFRFLQHAFHVFEARKQEHFLIL